MNKKIILIMFAMLMISLTSCSSIQNAFEPKPDVEEYTILTLEIGEMEWINYKGIMYEGILCESFSLSTIRNYGHNIFYPLNTTKIMAADTEVDIISINPTTIDIGYMKIIKGGLLD